MADRPRDHTVPGGGPSMAPAVVLGPEPDDAERARTMAAAITTGTLGTLAIDPPGTPFGSVSPFGLDDAGRPVICISELAEHTRNLRNDARASMLVVEPTAPGGDPLAAGRVTLLGRGVEVDESGREAAKAIHLAANPHAAGYVDYGDFSFWRLEVDAIRYVGGYGRMSWIDAAAWAAARPDPVATFAAGAVEHLNADHADALLLMAQTLAGRGSVTTATAVGIDRLGLELVAVGPDGPGRIRLAFAEPAATPDAIRAATVTLAKAARSA
jgi:putative heme iron utilization protein